MTDLLNNCPRCGHALGHCTHTTQGEITIVPARMSAGSEYSYGQLAAQYASTSFSNAHREEVRVALGLQSLSPTSPQPADTAIVASPVLADAGGDTLLRDARRYRRLRVLGCAPSTSQQLHSGTVLCFTNLDYFVDLDLSAHPSRGEAQS